MKLHAWAPAAAALLVLTAGNADAQVGRNEKIANPNRMAAEDLAALPHMNEALAAALVEGRPFLSMQDFDLALGALLTDEQRAELRGALFVPLNLNTASREEMYLSGADSESSATALERKHLSDCRTHSRRTACARPTGTRYASLRPVTE